MTPGSSWSTPLLLSISLRGFSRYFVHRCSGKMTLNITIMISLSYCISTMAIIYNQHLLGSVPNPQIDLKYIGVVLFLMGIVGNFYHHCILSKLRENSDTGYKIPKGGLFGLVICPHYLFEILTFVGISVISQSLYPILYTVGTGFYLTGRSYATRKWYTSKFPSFPKSV
ncbi:3-oxo-5-alpha-steroid 4-dehydrogenase 1-like [Papaver somniferum]|uniref:3-oxo-5-alpha-steroid 4-dehydrogenase 1-like n=1 Tax=Papaver somniferum TaxID=3469 RepID=UPI000E6F84D2|nr:3-oxo-5-alpha-steroid 4-dehydrogenase 1-like [Papaver somniferum]